MTDSERSQFIIYLCLLNPAQTHPLAEVIWQMSTYLDGITETFKHNINTYLLPLFHLLFLLQLAVCCGTKPVASNLVALYNGTVNEHAHTDRHTQPEQQETREEQL